MSSNTDNSGQINVMLVDDSAVIRGALARILKEHEAINIAASVQNGELAIEAAKKHQPHVIILDIEMPVMDGLTALPKILEESPDTKVIMFSTLTEKGAAVTMEAMSLGAVECLVKPSSSQVSGENSEFQRHIINLITKMVPANERAARKGASAVPVTAPSAGFSLHSNPTDYTGKPDIVVIGSSTGGPQALFNVIKNFKDFDIPIVITQHMPATFTRILAQHITQKTGIPAHEAEEGMKLENGTAYVAKGGLHMVFEKQGMDTVIKLDDGPQENFCKPAVDPMFRSALEIYGNKMLAVILTGMGHDGLAGGKMLVEKGARLIAQDEKTSVVWGMPGAVAQAGICTKVLPLDQIGPWVRKEVLG